MFRLLGIVVVVGLVACSEGSEPARDAGARDAGVRDAGRDEGVRDAGFRDGGVRDAGVRSCQRTCQCPQGEACIDERCRAVGRPVYCCDKAGCPGGEACIDTTDRPGTCEGEARPDAGSCRYDAGPAPQGEQPLGGYCDDDVACEGGLVCLSRDQPPGFWGYCTITDCGATGCPVGSGCFDLSQAPRVTGCLQACNGDPDCRRDAHCVAVSTPGIRGVCIPDCRDDFLDCEPRDGTSYCSRTSGRCEASPSQQIGPRLGGKCADNLECGTGEVCLGELAFGYPCGMCGRVCAGAPEATSCPSGSTCRAVGSLGVCFVDCAEDDTCPQRPDALCEQLDGWDGPGCVPRP